jgi:hypothetical protein
MNCCIPGSIRWHQEGGGDTAEHQLGGCDEYEILDASVVWCSATFACGGNGILPTDVQRALNQADVRAAFTAAPTVFGATTGVVDVITIDGNEVKIGPPCAGAASCTDAPAGVTALLHVLDQIALQQLGHGGCTPGNNCYAPIDPGPCNGSFARFGYDVTSGTCKEFTYGGCNGSANSFATQAACEQTCRLDPCAAGHPVATDAGNCVRAGSWCLEEPVTACACACFSAGKYPDASECLTSTSGNEVICQ